MDVEKINLLVAATDLKEVAQAQAIAVRLSKEPKIAITVLVDDLTHRLMQEFPAHISSPITLTQSEQRTQEILRKAHDLAAWADLLVVVPLGAGSLRQLVQGIAGDVLSEVLRAWDVSKRVIAAPGMTTDLWDRSFTEEALTKVRKGMPWIRVVPPILWDFDAASLDASGRPVARWDSFNDVVRMIKNHADMSALGSGWVNWPSTLPLIEMVPTITKLPPEIWSMVMEELGDWELAQTLGVTTNLPFPTELGWRREPHNPGDTTQVFMHELEWTLLTADEDAICKKLSESPAPLEEISALALKLILHYSLMRVLAVLEHHHPLVFRHMNQSYIPWKAGGVYGRTDVLDWWSKASCFQGLHRDRNADLQWDRHALDTASSNGYVHVLDWWRQSGLPLKYSEAAMELATLHRQSAVLEWWRDLALKDPEVLLKPGRSLTYAVSVGDPAIFKMLMESAVGTADRRIGVWEASDQGNVELLNVCREVMKDEDLLYGTEHILDEPTRRGHFPVLEWWKDYALGELPGMNGKRANKVGYRIADILSALEDVTTRTKDRAPTKDWWTQTWRDVNTRNAHMWRYLGEP